MSDLPKLPIPQATELEDVRKEMAPYVALILQGVGLRDFDMRYAKAKEVIEKALMAAVLEERLRSLKSTSEIVRLIRDVVEASKKKRDGQ